MSEQKILQIQTSVAQACESELCERDLAAFLQSHLHNLHHIIGLPEENAHEALLNFVKNYIKHAPELLYAISHIAKQSGFYELIVSFLDIAEDYFIGELSEFGFEANPSYLLNLLDEAYLTHRLIEELNDRISMQMGSSLVPTDMTYANLIVHNILGEKFANELDSAVHYAIEVLFENSSFKENQELKRYIDSAKDSDWKSVLKEWPCLTGDSSFSYNFDFANRNTSPEELEPPADIH